MLGQSPASQPAAAQLSRSIARALGLCWVSLRYGLGLLDHDGGGRQGWPPGHRRRRREAPLMVVVVVIAPREGHAGGTPSTPRVGPRDRQVAGPPTDRVARCTTVQLHEPALHAPHRTRATRPDTRTAACSRPQPMQTTPPPSPSPNATHSRTFRCPPNATTSFSLNHHPNPPCFDLLISDCSPTPSQSDISLNTQWAMRCRTGRGGGVSRNPALYPAHGGLGWWLRGARTTHPLVCVIRSKVARFSHT